MLPFEVQPPSVTLTFVGHCRNNMSSGPRCSKLTTLLVNISLKFQTLISEIRQYFLLNKCEKLLQASLIFSTKKSQCIWL